jgi:cytochrome c2
MKVRNNVEANAVVAYLVEKSGRETYPDPPAGDLAQGRKTFETIGCLACHRVGPDRRGVDETLPDGTTRKGLDAASFRTHGPNLDGTGSKVNAGWLYAWVRNPKGYWHDTRMPNLRLTDKEAADLTAYLMSLKNDAFMAQPRPPLQEDIRNELITEHLLAANVPVAEAERQLKSMDDHQKTIFVGEKTIGRYGCFGCHTISGFEKASPIGVELTEEGSKLVERLDFGFEEGKIPHTLPGWVHRKVMEPRVFDEGKHKRPEELLRMPKFGDHGRGSGSAGHRRHVLHQGAGAPGRTEAAQRGRALHRAGSAPGAGQELPRLPRARRAGRSHPRHRGRPARGPGPGHPDRAHADRRLLAAAPLQRGREDRRRRAGADGLAARVPLRSLAQDPPVGGAAHADVRVHRRRAQRPHAVLRGHGQGVVSLFAKPQPDPTLVAAGRDLFGRWQCVKCHVVAGKLPNQPPENMAPDLANVPRRLRAEWLHPWLADPGKIQPGTRMPANFPRTRPRTRIRKCWVGTRPSRSKR